jgi:hypothetical protein
MDWLRSEDLKEEKVVTTPAATITRQNVACWSLVHIDLWSARDIVGIRGKRNQETFGQERPLSNSSRKWRSREGADEINGTLRRGGVSSRGERR